MMSYGDICLCRTEVWKQSVPVNLFRFENCLTYFAPAWAQFIYEHNINARWFYHTAMSMSLGRQDTRGYRNLRKERDAVFAESNMSPSEKKVKVGENYAGTIYLDR